jgi:hypothetical protein
MPSIEYYRISSTEIFLANGTKQLTQDRIQLTMSATTYAALETLIASVRSALDMNRTNFILAFPLGIMIEGNDQNPPIYWASSDWYILY